MQFNQKIRNRLILILLLVAIIPMATTTIINTLELSKALKADVENKLKSELDIKTDEIIETLTDLSKDASLISWTQNNFLDHMQNTTTQSEKDALKTSANVFLTKVASTLNFTAMSIVDTSTKEASYMYGLKKSEVTSLLNIPEIEEACKKTLKSNKTEYTNFVSTDLIKDKCMYLASPCNGLKSNSNVLLIAINNHLVNHIITEGLSETLEEKIYIIDNTNTVIASTYKKASNDLIGNVLNEMESSSVDTVELNNKFYIHLDFGKPLGLSWFMIAEFDKEKINAEINAIILKNLKVGLFMCIIAIIAAIVISNSFAKPIVELTEKFQIMSQGDLTVEKIDISHKNEIGKLMQAFNDMLDSFRIQVTTQQKTSLELSSALAQISATISQLSTNSTETSSAISEISTTMEEVKQTSQVASDKAIDVADKSKQVDSISKEGFSSTMKTIEGISNIKEEMTILADSIVKLSNQSQSIAEIIDAVSNIAEQSNLLSVNAAIEAAKAGEFGKGFSVVAQEVKSLAEQSKGSTKQVRQILDEIQKATADAVMATERGAKAVDSGVELSQSTGSAIRTLEQNISESARAASQISASSKQQLVGIEQLSVALQNIKEATDQNLEGIMQLEEAATSIRGLGEKVKTLTSEFKV
ncbi:MAG: methyl-accepting chemotaxis protein [Sedimentisphaeraceae bacterium JB056]